MAADENFALVRYAAVEGSEKLLACVVRTYLSRRRAEEDLALLEAIDPGAKLGVVFGPQFAVVAVEYIDN